MTQIHGSIADTVGNTPLVRLRFLAEGLRGEVLLKLESRNPLGSVKDRIAVSMIRAAEEEGVLKPGMCIVEPTSGNTGIGLAFVGASRGYRVTLTMPDTMSVERRTLLKALGAEVVLTPGKEGMKGAVKKAEELMKERKDCYMPQQFRNPANPRVHYETTGPEIWRAAGKKVDAFVAGIGTGGTLTGAGRYLRERNPSVYIAGVEPAASPVLSGGEPGPHKIQGIGAGFVPAVLDTGIYDEIVRVREEDAFATARRLAVEEGILAGISSGANVWAALELLRREEFRGKTIVTLAPDTGERYLSTSLFAAER